MTHIIIALSMNVTSLSRVTAAYICAAIVTFCVLLLRLVKILAVRKQKREIAPSSAMERGKTLASEDELTFGTVFHRDAVTYLLPARQFTITALLTVVLTFPLTAGAFLYLQPAWVRAFYGSNGNAVAWTLWTFGWFAVACAQYTLSVAPAPEPNEYRQDDRFELRAYMRALYAGAFVAFSLASESYPSLELANNVLRVVFCCLPALWLAGVLPPLDVLPFYLVEQCHILLLGGTPHENDLLTGLSFAFTLMSVTIAWFIPNNLASVTLASALAFVASNDCARFALYLFHLVDHRSVAYSITPRTPSYRNGARAVSNPVSRKRAIRFVTAVCLCALLTGLLWHTAASTSIATQTRIANSRIPCFATLTALSALLYLTSALQRPLLPLSFLRNPLFTHNLHHYPPRPLSFCHRLPLFLHRWSLRTAPLLLTAFISLHARSTTISPYPYLVAFFRAIRWSWQAPRRALFEVAINFIVVQSVIIQY